MSVVILDKCLRLSDLNIHARQSIPPQQSQTLLWLKIQPLQPSRVLSHTGDDFSIEELQ